VTGEFSDPVKFFVTKWKRGKNWGNCNGIQWEN